MKCLGTLSPWMTPRTLRPSCRNGISKVTSLPLRALPRSTQVPPGISASMASRNTAGSADVSIDARTPRPGDGADVADGVAAGTVVDRVRRAELAGERKTMRMDVDRNDGIAARDLRRHQGREADRADAEHGKLSPRSGLMTLRTAPAPVCPLQASGPSSSSGASLRTFTA